MERFEWSLLGATAVRVARPIREQADQHIKVTDKTTSVGIPNTPNLQTVFILNIYICSNIENVNILN